MVDTLSILMSLFGVVFVVVRAVKLDRTVPWFQTLPPQPEPPGQGTQPAPRR